MTDKKPKNFTERFKIHYAERQKHNHQNRGEFEVRCNECFSRGYEQGKQELAKTILTEGFTSIAVGDKRYIAFEVERLKSQLSKQGAK